MPPEFTNMILRREALILRQSACRHRLRSSAALCTALSFHLISSSFFHPHFILYAHDAAAHASFFEAFDFSFRFSMAQASDERQHAFQPFHTENEDARMIY